MAAANHDDWTEGWSWDLPAKPLDEQRSEDGTARPRRAPFWWLRRHRAAAEPVRGPVHSR